MYTRVEQLIVELEQYCSPSFNDVEQWWWLPYDQLNTSFLPLNKKIGIILIESYEKGSSKPYHKQKLCFLLSNMRHFALELIESGYTVRYLTTKCSYREALESLQCDGLIQLCRPAELSLREECEGGSTKIFNLHNHPGWLTQQAWFIETLGTTPPFRMDRFYQRVRRELGVLMEDDRPVGGKYSHDADNRQPWKGDPPAPDAPTYSIDAIDEEVVTLVNIQFASNPGEARLDLHPTSAHDVDMALDHAVKVLPYFGPYEDAFSEKSRSLFHSRLAPLLNLHRIMPVDLMNLVLAQKVPLSSKEGFFRQLIWREYVFHIHDVTHGFRTLELPRTEHTNRNARWSHSSVEPQLHPNSLHQYEPLLPAFWGAPTGLRCLDKVVEQVLDEAWTHHIPRLMILSNIANLLDVNPRELTDWFHSAFIDAFDWVVEPNVLGMGTFALGDAMMTKPYVSGSAYIHRMGDSCSSCAFHPKKTCPITRLYWNYFDRHKASFEGNHRLSMTLRTLERRKPDERKKDAEVFTHTVNTLRKGKTLSPGLGDFGPKG